MDISLEKKIKIEMTPEEALELRASLVKTYEEFHSEDWMIPIMELHNKIILCLNNG